MAIQTAPLLVIALLSPLAAAQQLSPDKGTETDLAPRVTAVSVSLSVDGPLLLVEQEITVQNRGALARDFELVFPLGRGEVVSGLTARVDGRELEGALFTAEQASAIYRRMASDGRDPSLLEHYGEGLYRARIAAIGPGITRSIRLAYSRLVDTHADALRLHLPLTAFRRSAGPVHLTIEGEIRSPHPASALYSPTHAVVEARPWVSGQESTLVHHQLFRVEDPASLCTEDFEAFFRTRPDGHVLDVTVLSERPDPNEDGYFLAVIHGAPDDSIVPEPKNVVFVVDRSGSMKGEKLIQARAALAFLVARLRPEDRFNIISYAKEASPFADRLLAPTPAALAEAHVFIESIAAEGGTNIGQALALAQAQFTDTTLVNQIVFMTDGLATEGETDTSRLCALVKEENRHGARLVAFGLGFDVNGVLLDRLAEENRGMSEFVLPDQDIQARVPDFYARMHTPLFLDTSLAFTGSPVHDLFPRAIGDVYGGHKIVLTGRYSKPGPVQLSITGRRGREAEAHTFEATLAADTSPTGRDLVARIWAAKKIGFLVDEIRLDGETPERVEAIVHLGTRFGVLTEYTAFLADEDTDLYAFAANTTACSEEVKNRTGVAVGTHGVAQACNSKALQRGDQAIASNSWVGANGETVNVSGVQCIAGKAFFKRGETWRQSDLAEGAVVEEVPLYSEEFFALLDQNPWLGRCVARTGDITLELAGKNVRLTSTGS